MKKILLLFLLLLTLSPSAVAYYGVSPYAYCAGDPVNRRDVDGNRLEFEKGSSFNFMYQFHKAYAALDAAGAGTLLKRILFDVSFTITMKELSNEGKEVSRYDKGVILWAPNKAAMLDGNNGSRYYMAPMEILNHEADHGIDDKTNHKEHVANSRPNTDSQYGTVEEKRVITGSEQDTAKKLGKLKSDQVTRTNHDGTSYVPKDVTSEEYDHMPGKNY